MYDPRLALYDPAAGGWTVTDRMTEARGLHTATRLRDGSVLVTGGGAMDLSGPSASSERYLPSAGRWIPAAAMSTPRCRHLAAPLPGGAVVVAGGAGGAASGAEAEVYRP